MLLSVLLLLSCSPVLRLVAEDSAEGVSNPREDGIELEVFRRAPQDPELDMLLLLFDGSCSSEETDAVVSAWPGFLDAVPAWRDLHVGVLHTGADNPELGVLNQRFDRPWLDSRDDAFDLDALLSSGWTASLADVGLAHLMAALTNPPEANEGFRRPGAPLHVVVVSDRDDSSTVDLREVTGELEGRSSHVALSTFTGGLDRADPSPRYDELREATGGLSVTHDADQAAVNAFFQQVATHFDEDGRLLYLRDSPDPATLEVRLVSEAGVVTPVALGGCNGCARWEPSSNALILDEPFQPDERAEVRYRARRGELPER